MSRYRFIEAESGRYPVTQLCRITEVSRTAFYDWQEGPSARAQADAALTALIRAIHKASDGQYGVPRVLAELRAQGRNDVGRKRVARLMKAAGLQGRRPPRWVRTTTLVATNRTPPRVILYRILRPTASRRICQYLRTSRLDCAILGSHWKRGEAVMLLHDFRYAFRMLRSSPLFAVAAAIRLGDDGRMTGGGPDFRLEAQRRDILGKMIGGRPAIAGEGRLGRDRFDPQQREQALQAVVEIGIDAVEDRLDLRRVGHIAFSLTAGLRSVRL